MKIKKDLFIFIPILLFLNITFLQYTIFAKKLTKDVNKTNIKKPLTNIKTINSKYTPLENIVLENNVSALNKMDWGIFIPKINLIYPILNGTDLYTLDYGIGHFKESPKEKGNICLAGHNIGLKASPFKNISQLNKKDKLYYKYNNRTNIYLLDFKKEIEETDFKYIENTKEDHITVITCIMNKPNKRLVARFNKMEDEI